MICPLIFSNVAKQWLAFSASQSFLPHPSSFNFPKIGRSFRAGTVKTAGCWKISQPNPSPPIKCLLLIESALGYNCTIYKVQVKRRFSSKQMAELFPSCSNIFLYLLLVQYALINFHLCSVKRISRKSN